MFENRNRTDFYQSSERGRMLRAMTLNDVSYWGSYWFISIIFALFVIEYIEGGSATHAGLGLMVYSVTQAILSIPVGKFFDFHKGYVDEVWGLALASFSTGTLYIFLSYSSELWQFYIVMLLAGGVSAVNIASWRILFYNNVEKASYGETIGIYQTIFSIGQGAALAFGGFFGETFGFDAVVFWGGVAIFCGGFLPIIIRGFFVKRQTHRTKSRIKAK